MKYGYARVSTDDQNPAELEAQRVKDSTVEEFSRRLMAHGVPEQATQQAVAEMRSER